MNRAAITQACAEGARGLHRVLAPRAGVSGPRHSIWQQGGLTPFAGVSAMIRILAVALCLALPAAAQSLTQAQINQTLREHPQISQGLFIVALATAIRDICPSIDGRFFRGLSFLNSLQDQAVTLGFTRPQIRAFVEDQAEVARMYDRVRAYAAERGAREDQPETVCALGRAEIAAGSAAGRLLRQR